MIHFKKCKLTLSDYKNILNTSIYRNNLLTFFNTPLATAVCIIVAIMLKFLIAWTYTELGNDTAVYLLYANHLVQVGFMAEPIRSIETGEIYLLFQNGKNAPLYSLLAAPLLALNLGYVHTHLILSVAGWTLFYTGLLKLTILFYKKRWLANIFIIFSALFLYPHELSAGPKDTLAVAFTIWSIYLSYRFIQLPPKLSTTVFLFLSLSGLTLVKYLYSPLLVVFVVLMLLYIVMHYNRQLAVHFILLLVLFFAEAMMLKYFIYDPSQQFTTGSLSLVSDGTVLIGGIYPENLLSTFPFISSSIINTNFWGVQGEKLFDLPFDFFTKMFRFTDFTLLLVLLTIMLFYWRKMPTILFMTFIVAATLTGSVMLASLTTKGFSYKISNGIYTYVTESRSFIVPMVFLQLLVFYFIFQTNIFLIIKKILLFLLVLNVTHNIYFRTKEALNYKKRIAASTINTPRKKILKKTLELKEKDINLALVSSDDLLRRHVSLYQVTTYAFTNQTPRLEWMKKGQSFLIATPLADSNLLKLFPPHSLQAYDTVQPFILHYYKFNGIE